MVFCHVNSWLTGRRLVSLPFSDYCEPLCDSDEDANFLIICLRTALKHQRWKYLEIRAISRSFSETCANIDFVPAATYYLHTLDLRPDLNKVFSSLHKNCVQRRIQRAQRADLVERCGQSGELLKEFYALFAATRRRHCLPPVPFAWFQNLIRCYDKALEIRLAYREKTPIAAILTLRFREIVYYKYGGLDMRFKNLGAMPWLLWNAVTSAQSNGATEFDLGRTQADDAGLLVFKNHWVRQPKPFVYQRFPCIPTLDSAGSWKFGMAKQVFSWMPDRLLAMTGRLLYRHIG